MLSREFKNSIGNELQSMSTRWLCIPIHLNVPEISWKENKEISKKLHPGLVYNAERLHIILKITIFEVRNSI